MRVLLIPTLRYTSAKPHRADCRDPVSRLQEMIGQWMRSDASASWEEVAAALGRIQSYGRATAIRFREAVGLPPGNIIL